MLSRVLPSKLTDERITVTFDFRDQLQWGETIQSFVVDVSVASGQDGSPELLIFSSSLLYPTRVEQKFWAGVPGVIYNLTCTVLGTTNNSYEKVFKLAILPSLADAPPLNALFLTSRPYPVDVLDALVSLPSYESFWIHTWVPEGLLGVPVFISAGIVETLRFYVSPPEALLSSPFFVTGDVFTSLVAYVIPAEAVTSTPAFWSGDVETILIQYVAPAEALLGTPTFVSGTVS